MLTTRNGSAVIDAKAASWSKIAIFAPSEYRTSLFTASGSKKYCHNVWCEKILKICLLISTDHTNVVVVVVVVVVYLYSASRSASNALIVP